jgi:hypothetical protein
VKLYPHKVMFRDICSNYESLLQITFTYCVDLWGPKRNKKLCASSWCRSQGFTLHFEKKMRAKTVTCIYFMSLLRCMNLLQNLFKNPSMFNQFTGSTSVRSGNPPSPLFLHKLIFNGQHWALSACCISTQRRSGGDLDPRVTSTRQ